VDVRQARIVSEPVTAYTRFLHDTATEPNIEAGEQIRWLPRKLASGIALPGNDFCSAGTSGSRPRSAQPGI